MMAMYQSELMTVMNRRTGVIRYFVKKCDVFQRVSEREYFERYDAADGLSCAWSKEVGGFYRTYRTMIYEH